MAAKLKIAFSVTLVSLVLAGVPAALLMLYPGFKFAFLPFYLVAFLAVEAVLLYATFGPRAPVFGTIFWKGEKRKGSVALTFDDGPNEPYTSQILEILKKFQVRATFFVVGQNAERSAGVLQRMAQEGHEIGNHTYDHQVLPLKLPNFVRAQIRKTSDLVELATGRRPRLFRAPHGWRNPWVCRIAKEEGCTPVAWTLGVWDSYRPGAEMIIRRSTNGLKEGCVLVLHDGYGAAQGFKADQLIEALPSIIAHARTAGFRFVRLSEMMAESGRGG